MSGLAARAVSSSHQHREEANMGATKTKKALTEADILKTRTT
jgi:hypothetical protein